MTDAELRAAGITTYILSAPECEFCGKDAWAYVTGLGSCCKDCAIFRLPRHQP
jgi:hypothetical protein